MTVAALEWDQTGGRTYETGVDHGVLYVIAEDGTYPAGVPWNGLTTVTESPSGADANAQYADNIKYLNLQSAEDFGGTIEAFTYPPEFAECDGSADGGVPGLSISQQGRKTFGFVYRSKFGNDIAGAEFGYKLHLVYGAQASPSEKAYGTVNDSPEAIAFSWDFTTTPVYAGPDLKPAALLVVNSTKVAPTGLTALEAALFGDGTSAAHLPTPEEVITLLKTA